MEGGKRSYFLIKDKRYWSISLDGTCQSYIGNITTVEYGNENSCQSAKQGTKAHKTPAEALAYLQIKLDEKLHRGYKEFSAEKPAHHIVE